MRTIGSALLATALFVSSAFAATATNPSSPLPAGKPAGVKEAALHAPIWVWVAGIGFVALGVGLIASGSGNGHNVTNTTNSTNP